MTDSSIDPKAPTDHGANARRMRLERIACEGLSTAALEAGIVAEMQAVLTVASEALEGLAATARQDGAHELAKAVELIRLPMRRALAKAKGGAK